MKVLLVGIMMGFSLASQNTLAQNLHLDYTGTMLITETGDVFLYPPFGMLLLGPSLQDGPTPANVTNWLINRPLDFVVNFAGCVSIDSALMTRAMFDASVKVNMEETYQTMIAGYYTSDCIPVTGIPVLAEVLQGETAEIKFQPIVDFIGTNLFQLIAVEINGQTLYMHVPENWLAEDNSN